MWDIETIVEDVDNVKKPEPSEHRGLKSLANDIHARNVNTVAEINANSSKSAKNSPFGTSFSPKPNPFATVNAGKIGNSMASSNFSDDEGLFPTEIPNSVQKSIFKQQFGAQNIAQVPSSQMPCDPMKNQNNYTEQAKQILKTQTIGTIARNSVLPTPPPPKYPPMPTSSMPKSNAKVTNNIPDFFQTAIKSNPKPITNNITPSKSMPSPLPMRSANLPMSIPEMKVNPRAGEAIRSQDIDCMGPKIQQITQDMNQRLQNNPCFAPRPHIPTPPPPPPAQPSRYSSPNPNSFPINGFETYPQTKIASNSNFQVQSPVLNVSRTPATTSGGYFESPEPRPNSYNNNFDSRNIRYNPDTGQELENFTPSFAEPKINQRPPENPAERNSRAIELLNQMQKSNPSKIGVLKQLMDGNPHAEIEILRQIKKTRYIGSVAFGMMMFNLQEMFGKDMIKDEVRQNGKYFTLSNRFIDLCQVALQESSEN